MNKSVNPWGVAIGIVAVVLIIVAAKSWATVAPGHKGLYVTFGKVSNDVADEGFTFKAPWTKVKEVSVQQSTVNDKTGCYSSDQQQLTVAYAVLYRIPENNVIRIFREYPGDPFLNLIKPRVEESIKRVVSTMRAEDSIKEPGRVKDETLVKLRHELDGLLNVTDLVITNIDLSDELEKAIERKQVAEQQALAMVYEKQRAEKAAEILLIQARAESEAIKVRGDALEKNPSVIMLNAVEKWDGKAPATLAIGDVGSGILLNK